MNEGPADTLSSRAAIQKDLDRLEEQANRNILKSSQDKCKVHLRRNNTMKH